MRRNFLKVTSVLMMLLFVFMVFSMDLLAAKEKFDGMEINLKGYKLKTNQKINLPYGLEKKQYLAGEEGPYLIVFSGPIESQMKAGVAKVGAKLIEYIPEFTFLSTMTPKIAKEIAELPYVLDVMIYQPAFKVNPSLKDEFGNLNLHGEVTVRIVTFGDDTSVLDNDIINAQGKRIAHGRGKVVVKMSANQLEKIANSNDVKYIEELPIYELFNDVAKGYMEVDDIWTLGYDGSGQVVGVCDTGLDTGVNDSTMHLDFQGRIDTIYALGRSTADDTHGHGTHVSGSVLGDGSRSNGQIKGMAPAAHLVFQSVLDSNGGLGGLPNDLNDLFAQAWSADARIHTNSWGASVNGDYDTSAREVDEYVWNKDMIILFAASNDGPTTGTIGSPGTAKNCITVGASENYRPSMGSYADDPTDIAQFSSRGWTEDGRIKPDIVAPGTWILSTKSTLAPDSNFWDTYNTYYAYMGGTSMATPLTAGAVATAREFMQTEWSYTPSPAMMKAAIINGCTDLGYGVPSQDQGWGRVNLVDSLTSKEYKYEDETYNLSTGGSKTYNYSIESTNTPLKLTLVWTDYPGSTTASKALINDLDLKVTSPSGTIYYGNDFTSPYNTAYDRLNNVENVFINTPELGTYAIEIKGYNVPNGPQPFCLFSSADFGIASGDITPPTCSIAAPTDGATVSDSVTYSATASDNVGVSRVDFLVDGIVVGTDSTSPYSISWDTTTHSNGSRTLQVKAYDAAGNVGNSSTISVTVDNVVTTNDVTEEFSGYVSRYGTQDNYFYIDVTATGDIDLTLNWASSDDLDMYLYNPSGIEVERAYTLNNPETISYTATTTGIYQIKVSAYSGSETFYLTATHPVNPSETAHLESVDYISTYKDYYITVGDSGTINVEASWSGSADMDIFLYNPSGSEVARAYTLRNPESISYQVSTIGTYRIRVDSYSGAATCTVKSNYPQ